MSLFEANIDLQFVVEEYAVANYIVNYISKVEGGMSKLLREAAADIDKGHVSLQGKLRSVCNVFLNGNLMSSQEAAYHCLSLPISKSSRACIFMNTSLPDERVKMLKSKANISKLPDESNEIYIEGIFEKYTKRHHKYNNIFLAEFATMYHVTKPNNLDINDDENPEDRALKLRKTRKILRYRRYKLCQDPENYYREQLLLFLPWREEFLNIDYCALYIQHETMIKQNKIAFSIMDDEVMDNALNNVYNDENMDYDLNSSLVNPLPRDQNVDILRQGGIENPKKDNTKSRYTTPKKLTLENIRTLVQTLNEKQRLFVAYVLHSISTDPNSALRLFLSGSAGVGKSTVIRTIFQSVSYYFDSIPGPKKDSIKVLLCAPSGKAAFLIGGVTLHTAFALPIQQFGGKMPELSHDTANTIREKLSDLKLLIIDEISMVGSGTFCRVDTRLRQIMGRNDSFGGIPCIVVGDLNQLAPVMDSSIFLIPRNNKLAHYLCRLNPLWEEFQYFELTQVMRQNDIAFIRALNNIAVGNMTADDIALIKSRVFSNDDSVPKEAIYLYCCNIDVENFNNKKINQSPENEHIATAKDTIIGKISPLQKSKKLQSMRDKKYTDMGGLPFTLRLKINIK